jgi:hypothetical protein
VCVILPSKFHESSSEAFNANSKVELVKDWHVVLHLVMIGTLDGVTGVSWI